MRILLIEDDNWLAESLRRQLSAAHEIVTVPSGQSALDHVDKLHFDVIIADLMLEDGLAIDILHDLQSYEDTAQVPVVVCSSLASDVKLEDLAAYGVVALLDKATVTPEQLNEAIQRAAAESDNRG
jgi:CheY-like chemotaxis protein